MVLETRLLKLKMYSHLKFNYKNYDSLAAALKTLEYTLVLKGSDAAMHVWSWAEFEVEESKHNSSIPFKYKTNQNQILDIQCFPINIKPYLFICLNNKKSILS